MTDKPRIAHLAGPTATIQNSPPLVTSNKARQRAGLAPMADAGGSALAFDALRAQRLAAPAKVYVEQFSAHPLEADAAELYGPPDGFIGADGTFNSERKSADDKPVYEIELKPEDGLYPMPYMALQKDGTPWEEECATPGAPDAGARQGFYPDGSRSFEEIDRLAVGDDGRASLISSVADVDFYRGLPPGGYRKGLAENLRTDKGEGDIAPEVRGRDFFPYKPYHLASAPPRPTLAKMTNDMQALADSGDYDGFMWTQGSPQVEETAYWYNLLIDTDKPICGNAAQRPNGQISNDGPKNLVDSIAFIASKKWADGEGRNRCGTVVIQEQQIFAAREVAKADARPGGYVATGGHGGIIGQFSHTGRMALTYLPVFKHTYQSEVNISQLPATQQAVRITDGGIVLAGVAVKDANGGLLPDAIPVVSIAKDGSYSGLEIGDDGVLEEDLAASIAQKLAMGKLTGFVVEGLVPYGSLPSQARHKVMLKAAFSGIPVAKAARGSAEGFADPHDFQIAAANLTGTKARLLLMACLLKFGSYPPAKDPDNPTAAELDAIRARVAVYQAVFDTH
jgi:L-asparaginase/Glu-tRNA(Gln) amidotransferase subunit D